MATTATNASSVPHVDGHRSKTTTAAAASGKTFLGRDDTKTTPKHSARKLGKTRSARAGGETSAFDAAFSARSFEFRVLREQTAVTGGQEGASLTEFETTAFIATILEAKLFSDVQCEIGETVRFALGWWRASTQEDRNCDLLRTAGPSLAV